MDRLEQIVEAVGRGGASELLDAITRPEADRAALIGRLTVRDDAQWLAEVLIDLETDEPARLQLAELSGWRSRGTDAAAIQVYASRDAGVPL